MTSNLYNETIPVPGAARFPIELHVPEGFQPEELETWPDVDGRLEWVGGRLLYMRPCGDVQQNVTGSLTLILVHWADDHPEYTYGTNEAGMILRSEVRAAAGAIWLLAEAGPLTGGYRRVPPVLAAEVAGRDEGTRALRAKSAWYLEAGVKVVWLILPATREVIVLRPGRERRYEEGQRLAPDPDLPGLEPEVEHFFHRLY